MNVWRSIVGEFKSALGSRKKAIPIIAILFIPILYAGVYLYAFWNPYGHVNRIPVAVVNLDQGAMEAGKQMSIGDEIVKDLKSHRTMDWEFVSETQATAGLNQNKYSMVVKIPADFTQKAVDALKHTGQPEPTLLAVTNDRDNFISAQISRNAFQQIERNTSESITKQYAGNLLKGIVSLSGGLDQAAKGAKQVDSGAQKLKSRSSELVDGATRAVKGAADVNAGASKAKTGAEQVASGSQAMQDAVAQLSSSLQKLDNASTQLSGGAKQSLQGSQKLEEGLNASASSASKIHDGLTQLEAAIKQYEAAHPETSNDPSLQAIVQSSAKLAKGSGELAKGQTSLEQNMQVLVSGESQLTKQMSSFTTGMKQASQGSQTMSSKAKELSKGSAQLDNGLTALKTGTARLSQGTKDLQTGIQTYTNGVSKVAGGANSLSDSLHSAVQQTNNSSDQARLAQIISDPVNGIEQVNGDVHNYGTGLAPYFLSLGLFVGALLMSIVIDFRTPALRPSSPLAWFAGKAALLISVGIVQALIADVILMQGIGLHVQNVPKFIVFTILTSLTFVVILQFLVTSMGNPGRFIAVILLVLQLTSSSGTYPNLLAPAFFRKIADWLPMTSTVSGFRYWIGGGNLHMLHMDLFRLAGFIGVFACLSIIYFYFSYRKHYRNVAG